MNKASIPSLIAGLGFGALYGVSARLIQTGRVLDGVDLSICTSSLWPPKVMFSGIYPFVDGHGSESLQDAGQHAHRPECSQRNHFSPHGIRFLWPPSRSRNSCLITNYYKEFVNQQLTAYILRSAMVRTRLKWQSTMTMIRLEASSCFFGSRN